MRSNDDKDSKPSGAGGGGRIPVATSGSSEPEVLDRELRELHDRYGDSVEVPHRLVELARRVAEAYARLDQEDGEIGSARPDRDRPDRGGQA